MYKTSTGRWQIQQSPTGDYQIIVTVDELLKFIYNVTWEYGQQSGKKYKEREIRRLLGIKDPPSLQE
jgi:hypothetical protein